MSIFATPKSRPEEELEPSTRVLFLHGLEGSPTGAKAFHLKSTWNAVAPPLRTGQLRELRSKYPALSWIEMPKKELKEALDLAYEDAVSAMQYIKPDVIVGSSMGGALLAKLIIEGEWAGASVFLAPGIDPLLGKITLPQLESSVWILAEIDEVVPNAPNIRLCKSVGGNLLLSAEDTHRLHRALETGLIDSAIVTAIELENVQE